MIIERFMLLLYLGIFLLLQILKIISLLNMNVKTGTEQLVPAFLWLAFITSQYT